MFDELFRRKNVDIHKAILFGFVQNNSNYIYETDILDGSFLLQIFITPDGNIDMELTEKATDNEYVLYKTNATGSFVGEVRKAIETILTQVADKCYSTEIFKTFKGLSQTVLFIPNSPGFSRHSSIFFATSRKFARKLRERCEKTPKNTIPQV